MAKIAAAGVDDGQRPLNGPQTTGREYRNLSPVEHRIVRENDVAIPMRDGTVLLADVYRPAGDGTFPALLAAAPYPRQLQDLGAPAGVIEAGASDFWVPRGYVHVVANLRGSVGSGGTWGFFDGQERQDLYDLVEWVAAQPWSDGNVGMIGISYYAMTQLAAATEQPPHLRAVFPYDVTVSLFEAANHNGLFSRAFITPWLHTLGVLSAHGDRLYRDGVSRLLRHVFGIPAVHRRFTETGGDDALKALRLIARFGHADHPWNDLLEAVSTKHPARDAWWDERDLTPLLPKVRIPVYLGSEWSNVPLHLSGVFRAWDALAGNPDVRMSVLGEHGLPWPWESMHVEALAWFDHWLKNRDTGILDGPRIRYWLPGAEQWRTSDAWPPPADYIGWALNPDGVLGPEELDGSRAYACSGPGDHDAVDRPDLPDLLNLLNLLNLPNLLAWTTEPLTADLDMVGFAELQLTATITADDTGWIVLLQDIGPDGGVADVTQGWLRAAMREVDEAASTTGRPALPLRRPLPVPPGQEITYRIPLVANARRFAAGHRIRLTLTSDDTAENTHAMLLFTHAPVGTSTINTIYSASRLLLPRLREQAR
jgi:predicted acyl esterase